MYDNEDLDWFLGVQALERLSVLAEQLAEPWRADDRWFRLTVALLQTDAGRRLGVIGCCHLAARVVVGELIGAL